MLNLSMVNIVLTVPVNVTIIVINYMKLTNKLNEMPLF